jgi:hypothetical protein
MQMKRRLVTTLVLSTLTVAALATPAAADHTHVMQVGNGKCVILAADGGERYVELPHEGDHPEDRRHPLHTKVHLGEPGVRGGQEVIWVKGSAGDLANCDGYVNG